MFSLSKVLAISIYVSWRSWVNKDRVNKFDIKKPSLITISAVCYTLMMVFFLAISPNYFFAVMLFSLLIHGTMGLYVEVFKPEQKLKESSSNNMLAIFWSFLLVDTAVTLVCFIIAVA
jgi:magnesium-transporting ATPase (P-type)